MKVFIRRLFVFFLPAFLLNLTLLAQRNAVNNSVQYETVYDDPFDINRFFVQIQPVYAEVFGLNNNIGFGLELDYYLKELMDFQVAFRTPYARSTDLMRDASSKNNDLANSGKRFFFGELGLTYHVIDRKMSSKSKFVLYSKNFQKYNRWKTMTPEHIYVPSNIRRIVGIRAGGSAYQSSFDVLKVLEDQGSSIMEILPQGEDRLSFYSNIKSQGFYIGGSLEMIKNIAIGFDNLYDQTANDLMFTAFFDILFYPFISVEDFVLSEGSVIYPSDLIDTNMLGFRGGIKGKFNRSLGFAYSVELGLRPGIQGSGFYLMGVFSVPVFGFRMDKGKGSISDKDL